jgi:hypothetical protein
MEVAYWSDAEGRLFKREPYVLVMGMSESEPELVRRYRSPKELQQAVRMLRTDVAAEFADYMAPRLGYVSWPDLAAILESRAATPGLEASLLDELARYLRQKRRLLP